MNGLPLALASVAVLAIAGKRGSRQRTSYDGGTLRWSGLPADIRDDAFILQSIRDGGFRRPQPNTLLRVSVRHVDDLWTLVRESFPGRDDARGLPLDLDAEDHWDERGPAHVVALESLLRAVFLDPPSATPQEIAQKWLREDRHVEWQQPDEDDALYDDLWPGHSRMAITIRSIGKPHAGMLLPPVVVDADGLVDGRHRVFAARLAGLRYVPVVDLTQLELR